MRTHATPTNFSKIRKSKAEFMVPFPHQNAIIVTCLLPLWGNYARHSRSGWYEKMPPLGTQSIRSRESLGGLLQHYSREAA